jgi:hypothetical protein
VLYTVFTKCAHILRELNGYAHLLVLWGLVYLILYEYTDNQ